MMDAYYPEVVQSVPGEGSTVYAYFSDGSIHLYDASELLEAGGVFEPIQDPSFFRDALTVMNGTVAWDLSGEFDPTNCIDIDPFVVYEAPIVSDPLEVAA